MSHRPSGARRIASDVLRRVWEDDAFAAAALSAELERHPTLDPRDRALATELVYGVLRTENALLDSLARFGRIRRGDTVLLSHLLIAAYQLAFLDRVPHRAAVHEAVSEVRRARGAKMAGFANAVLRKLAASGPLSLGEAVSGNAPEWLVARLRAAVGQEEAEALLGLRESAAGLSLRKVAGKAAPEWFDDEQMVSPSAVTPEALRFRGGGDPRKLPGYAEGAFVVQEEGAQLVTWAMGAGSGLRVLDACCGRGQKSSQLAEWIGPTGELWATDVHPRKLEQLRGEFQRMGMAPPRTAVVDWTAPDLPKELPRDFDRVLVDVPCLGDGTLRRRPEILRRLSPEDPARFTDMQVSVLRAAARCARPGGRVIYAACSVLREACEDVLAQVSDLLESVGFDAPRVASVFRPDESIVRLLPGRHGTDGYVVASLLRR